ncbi:MAG: helix-turn-helix domain-containing protein [Chloroflexi bacterium]|nr:helix-turn-helix domain-containing protein [Chloroflexota bacterium]
MKDAPVEVFPPGDFLKEELDERAWSQTDFADILKRPVRVVNEILNSKRAITPETAQGIADALGGHAQYWLNLESAWQLHKVRQGPSGQDTAVSRRARLYSVAPIRDMIRRHWIEDSPNIEVLELRVLEFLGKESFDEELPWTLAARKSTSYDEIATPVQSAWLARARQLALAAPVSGKYSPESFDDLVGELKTLLAEPEEVRRVPRMLADAGIRLVLIEPFKGSKIDGASFWLDSSSPVIALSLRFNRIDNFWFILMHELGHTKNRDALDNKQPAIDVDLERKTKRPPAEEAASQFAAETLVDQMELEQFINRNYPLIYTTKIQGFAKINGVHPGIVVGQLHYRDKISYAHSRSLLVPIRQIVTLAALTDGWGLFPAGV